MSRVQHFTLEETLAEMRAAKKITFMTGAGVSTPSGIPDYRSLEGVYRGQDQPEYLLSATALRNEPEKFYQFVQLLFHPEAKPNSIHQKMAQLETEKEIWVVTQNIDRLHRQAGSQHLVEFHGNLYECSCQRCKQPVAWQDYLKSDQHEECGGQIRPNILLYEEGLLMETIDAAITAVSQANLIVIVGTTFQVHPFCDLIDSRINANVLAINQTRVRHPAIQAFYQGDATVVFDQL